jgi:hypothetical protein
MVNGAKVVCDGVRDADTGECVGNGNTEWLNDACDGVLREPWLDRINDLSCDSRIDELNGV